MKFEAIAAMSQNRVIGKDGKIPWHIPEDFKLFKEITLGHRVIMGRKTFESLNKKSLAFRENIVISRQKNPANWEEQSGFSFYQNITSLIQNLEQQILKSASLGEKKKKNFIIGGQEIFQVFLPIIQTIHLSVVQKKFDGDTYLPVFEEDFKLVENKPQKANIPFLFQIWERKN